MPKSLQFHRNVISYVVERGLQFHPYELDRKIRTVN